MMWGLPESESTPFLDVITEQLDAKANITHVLGFNEPDSEKDTGGSKITPSDAAKTWIQEIEPLKDRDIQLGGPAVTGSPRGLQWLQDFFNECDGKCTVDFLPIHWYGNFEGLASFMGQVREKYEKLDVWVTEFAIPHADGEEGLKQTQGFYNVGMEYFDRLE